MVLCSCGDRAHLWVWRLHLGAARFSPQEEAPHTSLSSTMALEGGRPGRVGDRQGELGPQESGGARGQILGSICGEERSQRGTEVRDSVSQWGETGGLEDALVSGSGEMRTSPLPRWFLRQVSLPVGGKLRSHLLSHLSYIQISSSFSSYMIVGKTP